MSEICRDPLKTPATWHGPELQGSVDWLHRLSPEEVADLERGLVAARASGKPMTEPVAGGKMACKAHPEVKLLPPPKKKKGEEADEAPAPKKKATKKKAGAKKATRKKATSKKTTKTS